MKKSIAIIALLVVLLFAFTACPNNSDDSPSHTHSFSAAWTYNTSQHWNQCGCGARINTENHSGDPCVICGYDSTHVHSYSAVWSYDTTQHWHACGCGAMKDTASHSGNPCSVCGYAQGSEGSSLTSIAEVAAYLAVASGGLSPANAVPIAVSINLGTMTEAGSAWQQLLGVIVSAGKYVAIDLSNSSCSGGVFNPDCDISAGKSFITSLVLPATATSIEGYGYDSINYEDMGAFWYFSNLTTCTGINVTDMGSWRAFKYCTALQSVHLPSVTGLYGGVFYGCTALESVSFPASAIIVYGPFNGCTSLASFNLIGNGPLSVIEGGKALVRNNTELVAYPSAAGSVTLPTITSIGDYAFGGCTALQSVNIPAVTIIGQQIFAETGSTALTITMGNVAPIVGGNNLFESYHMVPKTVTVRVPAATVGSYDTAWQNAFTGGSSYITLIIDTY